MFLLVISMLKRELVKQAQQLYHNFLKRVRRYSVIDLIQPFVPLLCFGVCSYTSFRDKFGPLPSLMDLSNLIYNNFKAGKFTAQQFSIVSPYFVVGVNHNVEPANPVVLPQKKNCGAWKVECKNSWTLRGLNPRPHASTLFQMQSRRATTVPSAHVCDS